MGGTLVYSKDRARNNQELPNHKMGQEMAQAGAEIGNMMMNQRTLSGPHFCMEQFWKFEAQEDVAETVQKKWTIGDWCLKMMGVVLCEVGLSSPYLNCHLVGINHFQTNNIWVECQVFATGKSGPWIQAWDSVKKKNVCFQYTMYMYTQLYTTHMQSKNWKPGNTVDKYQETIPKTGIKYSVWYILHIYSA